MSHLASFIFTAACNVPLRCDGLDGLQLWTGVPARHTHTHALQCSVHRPPHVPCGMLCTDMYMYMTALHCTYHVVARRGTSVTGQFGGGRYALSCFDMLSENWGGG